jgi:ubiquinone/menaquinone biosynthesis C-methylase UbiE
VVDPSDRVDENTTADERHQCTLEEFAESTEQRFDLAFAVFVLEHVRDPTTFTRAAARVLRPGGVLMALTVNQWHYFGLAGLLSTRTGVAERVLSHVRDPEAVADYHVPTEYRLNSTGRVSRELARAGFSAVEYRMWDLPDM